MAIVAAVTIIGFSAFNLVQKLDPPQDGWYQVTPDEEDPQEQSTQIIGNRLPDGPEDNCESLEEENPPCAIYLEFDSSTTTSPNGMSVADATDQNGYKASINTDEGNAGYTFQEEPQ